MAAFSPEMLARADAAKKWRGVLGPDPIARPGNRITPLVDGNETYESMYRAIITAQSDGDYIYLLGWSCDPDLDLLAAPGTGRVGGTSLGAILGKFPKVQVRVMLWNQLKGDERKSGTKAVQMVNRLANGAGILDYHLPYIANAHHQKVMIVKGQQGLIGFCGGVDVHPNRVPQPPKIGTASKDKPDGSPQHDIHCRVEGPACADLLEVFDQRWRSHPETAEIDRLKGKLIWKPVAPINAQPSTDAAPQGSAPVDIQALMKIPARGAATVRVARTYNCVTDTRAEERLRQQSLAAHPLPLPSLPIIRKLSCKKERSVADMLFSAIKAAKKIIYLEEQYLLDIPIANALAEALDRGCNVICLIPHSSISDVPGVWRRRKAFISAVNVTKLTDKKQRGVFGVYYLVDGTSGKIGTACYVHAKTWIFDDMMTIIGSANCNRRGLSSDSEANLGIVDAPINPNTPTIAQSLRQRLWAMHLNLAAEDLADPVASLDHWAKPGKGSRVRSYNPNSGKDKPILPGWLPDNIEQYADDFIDPDYDSLPLCQGNCC